MKAIELSIFSKGHSTLIALAATALEDKSRMVVTINSRGISLKIGAISLVKNCHPNDLREEMDRALERVREKP